MLLMLLMLLLMVGESMVGHEYIDVDDGVVGIVDDVDDFDVDQQ